MIDSQVTTSIRKQVWVKCGDDDDGWHAANEWAYESNKTSNNRFSSEGPNRKRKRRKKKKKRKIKMRTCQGTMRKQSD